jgi:hypothetical protein
LVVRRSCGAHLGQKADRPGERVQSEE